MATVHLSALERVLDTHVPSLDVLRSEESQDAWRPCVALDRLLSAPNRESADWQLAVAVAEYETGRLTECMDRVHAAVARGFAQGRLDVVSEAWLILAGSLIMRGIFVGARQIVDQLGHLALGLGDPGISARHAEAEGWLLLRTGSIPTGEFDRSREQFLRARELYCQAGDALGELRAADGLASASAGIGHYFETFEWVETGLKRSAELRQWRYVHRLLVARALTLRDQGYRQPAREGFDLAVAWCRFVGDAGTLSRGLTGLGLLQSYAVDADHLDAAPVAEATLREALVLAEAVGSPPLVVDARVNLGLLYERIGDKDRTAEESEQARLAVEGQAFTGTNKLVALRHMERNELEHSRHFRFNAVMREALESIPDALFVFDSFKRDDGTVIDLRCEFRNSAASRMMGIESTEIRMLSDLRPLPEFDGLEEPLLKAVVERTGYADEIRVSLDGRDRWYARRVVPAGEGAALNMREVTELYAAAGALREAAERAQEADRAKSEFLANMSHEVRTPINGVLGLARLLSRTELDRTQKSYVDGIVSSADILLSVIGDVLDLSKIEAGRLEIESAPVSVRELLQALLLLFQGQATERGLQLQADVSGGVPKAVLIDGVRVRQVLSNLIGNALKFTPRGKVEVRVSAAENRLCFEVRDTGVGVPADRLGVIFEAFEQAGTAARRQGGTGLGLAISRRLVELMGGEMGATSELNEGSCFWFRLPLEAVEPDRAGASGAAEGARFDGTRVLLAEDNAINALVARSLLEHLGCEVEVATNGGEAVDKACAFPFAVIFMDVRMPGLDGLDATRQIRAYESPLGRRTPIVALTAGALTEEREECFAAGMDDFVGKPFTQQSLIGTLQRWAS